MRARAFIAASVLLASTLAYFVVTAGKWTPIVYVVPAGFWGVRVPQGQLGMDWYFRAAVSLLAGALAFPVARALAARRAWATSAKTIRFVFGLAFGVMLWATLYTSMALSTTPRQRGADGHSHADH